MSARAAFHVLVKGIPGTEFERVAKWWLRTDPVYAAQVRRVWLWNEWPERWGPDCGIDLVAEAIDGGVWAIQTKAYAETGSVTKASIDSFLSESNRKVFSFRLLVATTDHIAANALRAINGQEKPVGIVRRSDLEASTVDWPVSVSGLRAAKRRSMSRPRAHQETAIRCVSEGLSGNPRGQLIMACGTGKTLTALWIRERLAVRRTLVLLPSLALLEQTLREWLANATEPFPYLAVCSDETVIDDPVTRTADLGIPVTTDASTVRSFIRGRGARVVFSTYQSSPVVADAQIARRVPAFDLVVADEAHRCAGPAGTNFATVLDAARIRARKRLFMTATPRFYTGRIQREAVEGAQLEIASMDEEGTFGPVLYRLSFGEAIAKKLLSDYRLVISAVDRPTYLRMIEEASLVRDEVVGDSDARTLASQATLLKAMRRFGLRRVLTFHGRVASARGFARELPPVRRWLPRAQRPGGELFASWVAGNMNVGDRQLRLSRLRNLDDGERAVIANARCLAEGVDVPNLDGIAFIDPRRSQTDIIQAVGRAIRSAPGKTVGIILVPVAIAPGDDPTIVAEGSAFAHVWDVVNALRAHDPGLGFELDELRRALGRRTASVSLPRRIRLDLPTELGADFATSIKTRLVEQTTSTWEFWFGLLERYVAATQTSRVPADYRTGDYKLGRWVSNQRVRRSQLSQERQDRLSALPGWTWNTNEEAWDEAFGFLSTYALREGDASPSKSYVENGFKLGDWVSNQRQSQLRGRLKARQISRLEALPGWTWHANEARWQRGLLALDAFVKREGHARPPEAHIENGFALGRWVSARRIHANRLTEKQRNYLADLPGWAWDAREASWEEGYAALKRYATAHGDARPPTGLVVDGFRLGRWTGRQRVKQAELSDAQRARLSALPGWVWNARGDRRRTRDGETTRLLPTDP